ncbi:MAG: N-acetyl-gamma-glutamyl-phosphate reductase [Woeseiaceae bacterium]
MNASIALIGGRGYVGEALLQLILRHPRMELAWVSSRSLADRRICSVYPELPSDMAFELVTPEMLSERAADVVVLAMPNQMASDYVRQLDPTQKVIDLSADYRFDDTWVYGLPERNREQLRGAMRVSNPGCYATAIQLAVAPLLRDICGPPVAFGVSGYSGAGRTPSARNDPDRIRNNFLPYSLTGHVHESEVSHHLQQQTYFLPHVAEFFRGISVTLSVTLARETSTEELLQIYERHYSDDRLIEIAKEIPEISNVAQQPTALIGGFGVDARDGRHVCLVACIDNLLKGAASQAMQNMNLMLDFDEFAGVMSATE